MYPGPLFKTEFQGYTRLYHVPSSPLPILLSTLTRMSCNTTRPSGRDFFFLKLVLLHNWTAVATAGLRLSVIYVSNLVGLILITAAYGSVSESMDTLFQN